MNIRNRKGSRALAVVLALLMIYASMKLLVEEMENAVDLKVPLTVDAHAGDSWYAVK